jgi:putative membrane protein insertion efficiency factor
VVLKDVLIGAIRAYQWLLSPWIGGQCLYFPTCSEYTRLAIERHGALRGTLMGAARILRCRPGVRGGLDPVPARFSLRCNCENREAHPALLADPPDPGL